MNEDKKKTISSVQELIKNLKAEEEILKISLSKNIYLPVVFQNSHLDQETLLYYSTKALEVLINWEKVIPDFINGGMPGEEEFSIAQKNLANSFLENDDPFLEACIIFELVIHLSSPKVSYFQHSDAPTPQSIQQRIEEIKHIIKTASEMLKAYHSLKEGYNTLTKYSIYPGSYNIIPKPTESALDTSADLRTIIDCFEEELDLLQNTNIPRFAIGEEQIYPNTHKSKHNDFLKYLLLHLRKFLSIYFNMSHESVVPLLIPLARNLNIISDKYADFNRKLIDVNSRNSKIDQYFRNNYSFILKNIPADLITEKTTNLLKYIGK